MSKTNSDFQAVVLVGPGNRLSPLICHGGLPKCLLPIANKPMITFPITWLANAGVSQIIVVANSKVGGKLIHVLHRLEELGVPIEIVLTDENNGTVDALRAARPHLRSDFIVIGCDFITDAPLHHIADRHRLQDALMTVLLLPPISSQTTGKEVVDTRKPSEDDSTLMVYAGLDESKTRLLYLLGTADAEDSIKVPMSLLTQFPKLTLQADLSDAHCYLFSRRILTHPLLDRSSLESIRDELVPSLVRHQNRTANNSSLIPQSGQSSKDICAAFVLEAGYHCLRANTIPQYMEANRLCAKQLQTSSAPRPLHDLPQKSQTGNDCLLADNVRIGDRTSIKRTNIGNNVSIGSNVKIINCVLMDYVQVEDNVKLDGVIASTRSIIREKCALKDCEVGAHYVVDAETNAKGESLYEVRELGAA